MHLQTREISVSQVIGWRGWIKIGEVVLTTGRTDALDGGHPQVRWACVKDYPELLRGCSNGDVTHVGHLEGPGRSGWVQIWLPSVPRLLPLSGCHMSLEITFQPQFSSQPLLTECLHLIFFPVLCGMQDFNSMTSIEAVPPTFEAQSHNHWTPREVRWPHLRSSLVSSSNPAWAPPFPGSPP